MPLAMLSALNTSGPQFNLTLAVPSILAEKHERPVLEFFNKIGPSQVLPVLHRSFRIADIGNSA